MLPLFKRKQPLQPSVTPEDKQWIEESFDWLIRSFSFAKAKELPFILPQPQAASSGNSTEIATDQLQIILEDLCKRWEIDPATVALEIFKDRPPKKWYSFFVPEKDYSGPAGTYHHTFEGTQKTFHINIGQSYLKYHDLTTAILTHELAHVKLIGGDYISRNAPHMEPLTDLTCMYFGYGILLANTCITTRDHHVHLGYLPNTIISYTNALLCYITEYDPAKVIAHLNGNTRKLFQQDYNYLITTNDTFLTKEHIQKCEQQFHDHTIIYKAWKDKNFDYIIETVNSLLSKDANNDFLLNIVGYAYIETKQYRAAIDAFNKAIDKSSQWDHPYNNRGYCLLLLGEVDIAYPDLQRAMELNDNNSYTWRHLGIYSMLKNDLPKALECFEQAEKIDPATWTINYYLGLAHQRSGNIEKANEYFSISKDRAEAVDTIF